MISKLKLFVEIGMLVKEKVGASGKSEQIPKRQMSFNIILTDLDKLEGRNRWQSPEMWIEERSRRMRRVL